MKSILIIAAIVLTLGIVGNQDFNDEKAQENEYCKNVDAGIWPDYKKIYSTACTKQARSAT